VPRFPHAGCGIDLLLKNRQGFSNGYIGPLQSLSPKARNLNVYQLILGRSLVSLKPNVQLRFLARLGPQGERAWSVPGCLSIAEHSS